MKTQLKYIVILLLGLSAWSCTKDDLLPNDDGRTPEGMPAQMKISIGESVMTRGSGLSPVQEKKITSAQVMIFDRNGRIVTNQYFPTVTGNSIVSVQTRSGSNMSVYIVANITAINSNYSSQFTNIQTVNDLNAVKVYNANNDADMNKQLLMWGAATGVTIPALPLTATIPVQLNYVASKIHVYMIDDTPVGEDVFWTDWQVQNVSLLSYLIPQATDAVNPANASDFFSTTPFSWLDTTFMVNGVAKPGKYTVFYAYENRRGGRVANTSTPPSGYTPGAIGTTDPKDKTWYAPPRAVALVANGYYTTATSNKGLKATIFLGNNSYNDYNVERSKEYTFTVTTKGINQIDVDSRVDGSSAGFQVDVLNTTLDCHYDWRPIRLGSYAGTLSMQILDGTTGLPPLSPSTYWLKLSAINLNQFVNNGSGTYVRPTYNKTTDMLTSISNIAFTDASQITFKTYYLYADEFMTEGGIQTAQVKITSSQPGSVPIVIPITQKGYQTMGTVGLRKFDLLGGLLSNTNYQLAVENQEEATLYLTPGVATNQERTSTMQWGFPAQTMQPVTLGVVLLDYYKRNGFENSTNLVLTSAGALRPSYGRTGSTTISDQAVDPIFNTYAARYCFEKNRDLDGNGQISGAEIKWYLPSVDELMLMYVGSPSLSQLTGEQMSGNPYQSSTEYSTTDNRAVRFDIGQVGSSPKPTTLYVRCVRKL